MRKATNDLKEANEKLESKLQQQEAQLVRLERELQIEVALERVRSRTMAMFKSEELAEVATLLYQQIGQLGGIFDRFVIGIFDEQKEIVNIWATDQAGQQLNKRFVSRLDEKITVEKVYAGWKSGQKAQVIDLQGEEFWEYIRYAREELGIQVNESQLKGRRLHNLAYFSQGYLVIQSSEPLAPEIHTILERFATVFNLTYTRFLDLQKAEAQTREAQIEAALEKVRSSSLAMHRSTELEQVAGSLFDRLAELGLSFDGALIFIFDKEKRNISLWIATNHLSAPVKIDLPFDKAVENNTILKDLWNAIENGEHIINRSYSGEVKNEYFRYVTKYNESKIPESIRQIQIEKVNWTAHFAAEKNSMIGFDSWSGHPTKEEDFKILIRFAKVFEQAYTRFLDLQKAEAQAREAKIEAAIERVRSRTMAMQKSDELDETNMLILRQLESLDIPLSGTGIHICNAVKPESKAWMWDPFTGEMPKVTYNHTHDRLSAKMYEGWKKGETLYVEEVRGEKLKEHLEYISTLLPDPATYEDPMPEYVFHIVYFKYGFIVLATPDHCPTEHPVFIRFAKVFEQTFTRFLDVQKAEAQAREAQIQLGLERVRARAMAMQRSDELSSLISTVYAELTKLDVAFDRCFILMFDPSGGVTWWMASPEAPELQRGFKLPFHEHKPHLAYLTGWKERKEKWEFVLEGEVKRSWDEFIFSETELSALPEAAKNYMKSVPRVCLSASFSTFGCLTMASQEPLTYDAFDILMRFARVFDLTYTRFHDLQKAEANTRLAVRQASLDRLRAEIASMRTPADLQRIIPLVWNELTTLGIPFIRCGVFIIHEKEAMIEAYLSTPDGQSLAVLHLPFNASDTTSQTVDSWRRGKVYHQHWNREDFLNWSKSLMEQGQIQSPETYQGAATPPESLDLHFVPFTQGMLYVGSTHIVNDEEINLVKALAESFAIAYARYEDFIKLDKAKENTEITLAELKATQAQLIQKEKLASLGELTAGIAHEIQNPLNFVNNYAEVNVELLEELEEELKKGDMDQAQALLADLRENESKIHHHGQRADAIVRGMLEHARTTPGERQPTDLNRLADEYLRLAYQGLRRSGDPAKASDFQCELVTDYDPNLGEVEVVAPDIGRVLLNLYNNAFYAVQQKRVLADQTYTPTVWVSTQRLEKAVEIRVRDNGVGIPDAVKQKIFQPFFTTKPTGEGTGLGLSLAYDIVTKGHGGTLELESVEGEYTEFVITL